MCEKAISFLKKYVKDWLEIDGREERDKDKVQEEIENSINRQGHKYPVSYDIWEENDKGVQFLFIS